MTIMIGIDPHKATHTAVAIDHDEVVLDEFKVRASGVQARRLCDWAEGFEKREWAIEAANGLGYLLSQQLVAAGEIVFDVPPVLASRVRVLGSDRSQKNDPNDARAVAIAALRSHRLGRVRGDGHPRVLRLLVKRHRDMAQLRAKHCVRLHALLGELHPGGIASTITVSKAAVLLAGIDAADAAKTGPAGDFELTDRQLEVAQLVARGLTNKDIAKRLDVSPYTVETHVRNILERLDATNRTQIGAWVMNNEQS